MTGDDDPLQPPPTRILNGDEPIVGTSAVVRDFWARVLSDLRTNTVRPMLAEFLVAQAVGAPAQPRIEWDAYDVVTPRCPDRGEVQCLPAGVDAGLAVLHPLRRAQRPGLTTQTVGQGREVPGQDHPPSHW